MGWLKPSALYEPWSHFIIFHFWIYIEQKLEEAYPFFFQKKKKKETDGINIIIAPILQMWKEAAMPKEC